MKSDIFSKTKQFVRSSIQAAQLLSELVQGQNDQTSLLSAAVQRLSEIVKGQDNQTTLVNQRLLELRQGLENLAADSNSRLDSVSRELGLIRGRLDTISSELRAKGDSLTGGDIYGTMQNRPLMIDAKTYDTSHPDYDAIVVRNFPGKILNFDMSCQNEVYAEIKKLAQNDSVSDAAWQPILKEVLAEARTIPQAEQIFERRAYIEAYTADISTKYGSLYQPGWVNMDDALFLYWLVRQLKPKNIVQTGVCNGLSTAFMVLALAKNGTEGKLHAIDFSYVFNPNNPDWIVRNKVYGVTIPEGKKSGWLVPDAYKDRAEIWDGGAKVLLPKLVNSLDSIDMFYHDSDHRYDHMMFEFQQVKQKLRPGALVVADDISWNSSLWDFADQECVPAYNYKGAVGVAFISE